MKAGLLILPFLAFIIAGIGMAIGASYPDADLVTAVAWSLAAAMVVMWAVLDWDNLKRFFGRRGTKYGFSSGLVVILGILVIVGFASLSTRPRFNKSFDMTRDSLNTLSAESVKLLHTLADRGSKIEIDGYFLNIEVETQFKDLLYLYQEAGAEFDVEYIDPEEQPLRARQEKLSSANTVILRNGQNEKRITVFTEEKLTNGLANVLRSEAKKLYFTVGHGEGKIEGEEAEGYGGIAQILETYKYAIEPLNLIEQAKVPEDASVLVIAEPRYDFKEEEVRFLDAYLRGGGSLMVVMGALKPLDRLNGLMEQYGLRFKDNVLLMNEAVAQVHSPEVALVSEFDEFHPITRDFGKQGGVALKLQLTRSVEILEENAHQMKVETLGSTARLMAEVPDVRSVDDLKGKSYDAAVTESYPVIAVAYGKPMAKATAQHEGAQDTKADIQPKTTDAPDQNTQTRIVAVGSTGFGSNISAQDLENRDMFINMVTYLSQDEEYISITPRDPTKSVLNVESGTAMLSLLLLFVYPFGFLGGGVIYWMTRRNA